MLPLAAAGAGTNSGDAPERAAGLESGGRSKSLSLLPNTAFYELQVLAPAAVTYQSGLLGFGRGGGFVLGRWLQRVAHRPVLVRPGHNNVNVGFQHASHMHACVQKGCGPQANLRRAQLPHNPWQSADETLSPWLMDRYIGFDGTDSMARAASTAGVVLSALVGLRVRPTVTMIVLMRLQVQCLACCRGMPAAMSARCFVSTAAVRMQRLPLSEMCVRVHLNFDSVLLKTSCGLASVPLRLQTWTAGMSTPSAWACPAWAASRSSWRASSAAACNYDQWGRGRDR